MFGPTMEGEINPMIRNLMTAVVVLAAFGALNASDAPAAEEKFHCSVNPCTLTLQPDTTAGTNTAHHVFVINGENHQGMKTAVPFTCDQLTGQATLNSSTGTEATFTNLKYENAAGEDKCKLAASEVVTIDFTSCDYRLTSTGGGTGAGSEIHVECATAGDGIDVKLKGVTCFKITPFTAPGVGYHDVDPIFQPESQLTATVNMTVPVGAVDIQNTNDPTCALFLGMRKIDEVRYTTGNTIIKAEMHAGFLANGWFT
jgi:hypothetical protein